MSKEKQKGNAFENNRLELVRQWYPQANCPGPQQRGVKSEKGKQPPDIDGTPFYIECKWAAASDPTLRAARQALKKTDGRLPIGIGKQKHKPVMVAMPWEVFEHIMNVIDVAGVSVEWRDE